MTCLSDSLSVIDKSGASVGISNSLFPDSSLDSVKLSGGSDTLSASITDSAGCPDRRQSSSTVGSLPSDKK